MTRSRHPLKIVGQGQPTDADRPGLAERVERPPAELAPPELWERVRAILDLIRPAIQDDGGDVELVEVGADGQVTVRFLGACVGCPSSAVTLQSGIERNLREHVAEVRSVVAVP
jgi:Fe-S cluster biogenesis protein NfuA